jgi:uncharacterized membrane protein YfcA
MDHMQMWWAYLLLGLAAGTFGAALGVGGGVVMVPALVILFSFDQKIAQGTSMGAMIGIAIMGFYRYWAEPSIKIDFTPVIFMGIAAIAGAFLGVKIAAALPKPVLQKIFAAVMIVAAVRLFWKSMKPGPAKVPAPAAAGIPETEPPRDLRPPSPRPEAPEEKAQE